MRQYDDLNVTKICMEQSKRERLEASGWKVGTVAEFLEMTSEETALVEIKLALSRSLKERRQKLL
ncbi:XRE family transcriptional regulator [Cylindrospermum sp. NIES-4074]|nr:XRE family transcriptional regulator [Cylindrospermum sp. NIES-4074]